MDAVNPTLLALCLIGGVTSEPAPATPMPEAAPPTPAPAPAPHSRAQLFADLVAGPIGVFADGAAPAAGFVLERAELGADFASLPWVEASVGLEAIRSAGAQSAFGIDGNSLLARLKHAWAGMTPSFQAVGTDLAFSWRAGLVQEPWLARLERYLGTRALGPLPSERAGLWDTSDLGVNAGLAVADGLIALDVSLRNGEGKRELELNLDKDVLAMLSSTARLQVFDEALEVTAAAMMRHGTRGVASTPEERVALGVGAAHPRLSGGTELVWARGDEGDAARDRALAALFMDAHLLERWLGLSVRAELDWADAALPESLAARGALALFTDLGLDGQGAVRRLRLLGGVGGTWGQAQAAIAGVPAASHELRAFLLLEASGLAWWLAP